MTNDVQPERNAFFEAVGRVTVGGAHLDARLHNLLGALAPEPTLLRFANAATTDQLIQFCRLALKNGALEPGDVAEIETCLDRADGLRKRRNDVVHAIHLRFDGSEVLESLKPARRSLGYKATSLTVEGIEDLADEMDELIHAMFRVAWNAGPAKAPGMHLIPPEAWGSDAAAQP